MSNIISFERFAEFQPIEGLLDSMRDFRLHSQVGTAVRLIEEATAGLPETKPLADSSVSNEQSGAKIVNPNIVNPVMDEVRIQSQPNLNDPDAKSPEQLIEGAIDIKSAKKQVEAIYSGISPEYRIPSELQGV